LAVVSCPVGATCVPIARRPPCSALVPCTTLFRSHAVSARLGQPVAYPFLLLLVSGGHCQLLEVRGIGDMTRLGATIDDAAGEALDRKSTRLNSSHVKISYAVFCLKIKKTDLTTRR